MSTRLFPTSLVGSYPQPDWLIDRARLSKMVTRVRMNDLWMIDPKELEAKQDEGRAYFVLAKIATMQAQVDSASTYFQRALATSHDTHVLAWSHIYLGRLFDLQQEREQAVAQYRAALASGDKTPEVNTAAERGLRQPYTPGNRRPE